MKTLFSGKVCGRYTQVLLFPNWRTGWGLWPPYSSPLYQYWSLGPLEIRRHLP